MEKKKFKPQDFINDIKRISSFNDNRVLIWYCNLYIEHFIKLIYKEFTKDIKFEQCKTCNKSCEPSFMSKINELSEIGLVDKINTHDTFIKMIYKSRNIAGHELDFVEDKIIKNILKAVEDSKKEDPVGLISKLFQNISPWKKLEISATAVITNLYMVHKKMNNEELTERLIFEIDPECTNIVPKIEKI